MSASYEAKEHYRDEAVAAAYDRVRFRGIRGTLVDWLEQRLLMKAIQDVRPGGKVLDLPVGTGRMARRLAAAGYRVVGADVSVPMLRLARELAIEANEPAGLLRGEAETLPFADGTFDVAVCFRLLPHLPAEARTKILREMARVAHRVVAVYQPHKVSIWWLLSGLILRRPMPRHYVSAKELEKELAGCGLRVMRSHALLRGVLMARAYVLEPAASD